MNPDFIENEELKFFEHLNAVGEATEILTRSKEGEEEV